MALINFKDIDFNKSINKENTVIDFNGSQIEILPDISISDKYDLIMITLQKSFEKGIYNPIKLDMYFNLNLIYLFTNIVFTADERADEAALYDTLHRSGLISLVRENIREVIELHLVLMNVAETHMKYRNTFASAFSTFVEELPRNMASVQEILNNMDPEKMAPLAGLFSTLNSAESVAK